MNKIRLAAGFVLLFVILLIFYDHITGGRLSILSFGETLRNPTAGRLPLGDTATSAIAMLAGICFGNLYEHLKKMTTQISIRREMVTALTSAGFFRALLVSPIVFSGVYIAAQSQPDPVVASIFAFENGFLCEAILRKRHESS